MINFDEILSKKIDKGEEISPFLFTGKNLEILNKNIYDLWIEILNKYNINKINLFILKDNWEKIKIKEVKEFIEKSNTKSSDKFQIFFIENISRLTTQASNSLLKFFEEPWVWNIIFTTNIWENNILDTILSRVQIIDFWWQKTNKKNNFYQDIIKNFIEENWNELINYIFKSKLEKQDYIDFLENLIIYFKEKLIHINLLEEINEDINFIKQNNLNAKYIADKWIIKIKK